MEIKELLETIDSKYEGKPYNLCYHFIKNNLFDEKTFELLCDIFPKEESRSKNKEKFVIEEYITEKEFDKFIKIYLPKVQGILITNINKAMYKQIDPELFYLNVITELEKEFPDIKELAIAYSIVIENKKTPFISMGNLLSMENSEFSKAVSKNVDEIKKILYALNFNFSQKTERASAILNIILSKEEYTDQVILLSRLISILEKHNK